MKTDASVSAHSETNLNVANLDRLEILEMEFKRIASEHANMARKLAALESSGNSHPKANGASFLEGAESTALTDRRSMLRKVAGLAAGVAAAGLLRPTNARANNGDPLLFGRDTTGAGGNSATGTSRFVYNGGTTNYALFLFEDGTRYNNVNTGGFQAVLNGWATAAGPGGAEYGVFGYTESDFGAGVIGQGLIGVQGESPAGLGGNFTGGSAAIRLDSVAGAVADPNAANPVGGGMGDLYRGSTNGSLWYRPTNSTGRYRRLADDTTAGALTAFPASSRIVNLSPLNGGQTAAYQIGGVTVTGNTVPLKARAIIGRIADANPTGGGGGILVSATNPPPAGTGVLSVIAGAPQNSFFFSALDATGKLYVRNTSPSGSVQIIIDVAGYFE